MSSFLKSTFLCIICWYLVGDLSFVAAGRIPSRRIANLKRREDGGSKIDIGGLDVLKTYVCPPQAKSNTPRHRKHTIRAATMTVAVPLDEAAQLWQELHWIMDQLGSILEAEGIIPESSAAPNPVSTPIQTTPSTSLGMEVSMPFVAGPSVTESSPISRLSSIFSFVTMTSGKVETGALTEAQISSGSSPSTMTPELKATSTSNKGPAGKISTSPLALNVASYVSRDTSASTISPSLTGGPTVIGFLMGTLQTNPRTSSGSESSDCSTTQTILETTTLQVTAVLTSDNVAAGSTTSITPTATVDTVISAAASSTASDSSLIKGSNLNATTAGSKNAMATGSSSYTFDSQSPQNIAVYFGQSPVTGGTTLEAQCADPDIDIVILAFLISAADHGKYPGVNFGAACGGQTPAMMAEAPGLLSCTELEGFIRKCQTTYGKKVLLSIGGAASSIIFSSASDASNFADVIWQLFGPPGNIDPDLRPFGNVSVDGFDFDNENNHPNNYDIVASALRTKYLTDPSKSYYLSSAPQCPFPDASNPMNMLLICDFVFVQFYNNVPCEIGSTNFHDSIQQWSTALASSTANPKPRLYIGAPAWSAAGPTAYGHIGSAMGMQRVAADVKGLGVANLGGVMFWDGPEAMLNLEGGKNIVEWTKEGLVR